MNEKCRREKKSCDNDVGNNIGWRVINDTATDDDQIYGTWQDEETEGARRKIEGKGFQDSRVITYRGELYLRKSANGNFFSPFIILNLAFLSNMD